MKLKRAYGGWEVTQGVRTRWEPSFFKALRAIPWMLRGMAEPPRKKDGWPLNNCEPALFPISPRVIAEVRTLEAMAADSSFEPEPPWKKDMRPA